MRQHARRLFLTASLLTILPGIAYSAELTIPLVTYYDYAPFHGADNDTDLTRELAALLTKQSGGRYRFVPTLLPKKRLDNMILYQNWQGVVAWSNPRFFNDERKSRYLWTESLLMESDYVVSHKDAPVHYSGLDSLQGKTLGTVLNQRYADVEGMIDSHQLRRADAPSQEANVRKLLLKRVDVVFISRSTLSGLRHRIPGFEDQLYIAPQLRNHFSRHLMLTPELPPEVLDYVRETAAKFEHNPTWRDMLVRHHVDDQTPPRR